ncbi:MULTISPECIES: RNase P modulator RnpM [Ruminococcus]|uniref:YlxR family protein n=1 Tax=Ruminococcus bicirculans (ex Wegman et al. 2014) TaxID=1160721 RepID=A0AAW6E4C9_9FIRM|nr:MULTISPECIES: YlxR family protein [Ruminococcus]RGG16271.1 YlxR family protein [Ruminococcus sp. AF26-25AA]MBD8913646.1 YlxR family protein [Ruminococcus bicirculans (ex Wegman et al. 2014)]MDB8744573.1 YlxR family protein [Ruminococcus bicirculans (ex Wegman et al. 2014)]MDB8747565.1 YlxR family protein [Ruminococcus bicirculans (ex Wegman et al. 2014)]MDB8752686.1 YlxR family protein [Ruminococcus bicirculans (ex Wegman et al. 2014)]
MKTKKIPMRMCLGCGEMRPKRELIRVVKSKEGDISLDLTGKKSGRGAYICKSVECFEKARKARKFERSFSCMISEDIYNSMEGELRENE